MEDYKNKQYLKAYSKLSEFMEIYMNFENCRSNHVDSKIWAYSDLALAAFKMRDVKKCFQYAYDINKSVDTSEEEIRKPLNALLHNYSKCMELEGGKEEARKVDCQAFPWNLCGDFKSLLIGKKVSDTTFVNNKCKDPNFPDGLDLTSVGSTGCMTLEPFVAGNLEEGISNTCPKILWVSGSESSVIYVEPKKKGEYGMVENQILDDSNCCNIFTENLALANSDSKILLKMSGTGRDCYGGTASWSFEDIYTINFEEKKITLEKSKYEGLH